MMKTIKSYLFQPIISIATTVVTAIISATPSQAITPWYVKFTPTQTTVPTLDISGDVLSGIDGVTYTLPNTSGPEYYDIQLVQGSAAQVYGTTNGIPNFQLNTADQASAVMASAATGIDDYLAQHTGPLYFGAYGNTVYYVGYGVNPQGTVLWDVSGELIDPNTLLYYISPVLGDASEISDPADTSAYTLVPFKSPGAEEILPLGALLALGIMRKVRNIKKA